jgi:uncharacterized protein
MQKYKTKIVKVNGKKFEALLADSLLKRMIGLMFRKSLPKNQCMLFTFWDEGYQSIWMYNMLFSIDVIWANRSLRIVDIRENMEPCRSMSGCRAYIPTEKAKYVIEFSSGSVKSNRIKKGSKIEII